MKLEQQVCGREWSEKLKKLGVKQESLYYWTTAKDENEIQLQRLSFIPEENSMYNFYSAFTVAELGEMLPRQIELTHPRRSLKKNFWKIIYREPLQVKEGEIRSNTYAVEATTEANARAKMMVHLLENKLIK